MWAGWEEGRDGASRRAREGAKRSRTRDGASSRARERRDEKTGEQSQSYEKTEGWVEGEWKIRTGTEVGFNVETNGPSRWKMKSGTVNNGAETVEIYLTTRAPLPSRQLLRSLPSECNRC